MDLKRDPCAVEFIDTREWERVNAIHRMFWDQHSLVKEVDSWMKNPFLNPVSRQKMNEVYCESLEELILRAQALLCVIIKKN